MKNPPEPLEQFGQSTYSNTKINLASEDKEGRLPMIRPILERPVTVGDHCHCMRTLAFGILTLNGCPHIILSSHILLEDTQTLSLSLAQLRTSSQLIQMKRTLFVQQTMLHGTWTFYF